MSLKNSNDTIGNQTRDLPVCSALTVRLMKYMLFNVYENSERCTDDGISVRVEGK
jgi:hypothetical protein